MVDTFFEQALSHMEPAVPRFDAADVVEDEHVVEEAGFDELDEVLGESSVGYYIFAIALKQFELQLPDVGIDPDYPLFVFPFGHIQAVISEVPLDVYGEKALQARLNDSGWFEQTLSIHNLILEQIQSQSSMVPMRVCTICDSIDGLKAFLNEHHADFVSTLELIEGNDAWSLTILCNHRKLRMLTEKASNRVRAIHAEMAGKTGKEAEQLALKLEAVLEEEARSVCKACVKHSHGMLTALSKQALVQTPNTQEAALQEIFRSEYLVKRGKEKAFSSEAATLIESYRSLGFELRIQGPLPPSSFTNRKSLEEPAAPSRELRNQGIAPPKLKSGLSAAEA